MKISLRDPLWQFFAVVLSVLAIGTTIFIYYIQKQHKELSFEVISSTSLVNKAKEIGDKLKILYEDKPVNNIHLIVIRLTNSGNIPITKNDYENPLIFSFSSNVKLLEMDVIKSEPDNIKAETKIFDNKAIISPSLLNQSDSITFKIVLNEFDGFIKADARIFGIKNIVHKDSKDNKISKLINFVAGLLSGFSLFLLLFSFLMHILTKKGIIRKIN